MPKLLSLPKRRVSNLACAPLDFTSDLAFLDPLTLAPRQCYRVMDESGALVGTLPAVATEELALKLYKCMTRVQALDKVLFDAQRQGRLSFYMQSAGEEAASVASAAGLEPTDDVFAQYREQGILVWRGHPLQAFLDQCLGNAGDKGKGRQMPVHYGSKELHFQTIKSPLATQIPQAAGAAYAHKLDGNKRAVACYFGEGAASEGDFHAGLNFAATLGCAVVFICRNNGYAISTPVAEQLHGDGVVARAAGYGMLSSRVDGNDAWAVLEATRRARELAVQQSRPVLLELMTYRQGHHSTSDDSTRYRSVDEIEEWRLHKHPIRRMLGFLKAHQWWDEDRDKALKEAERALVLEALALAERKPLPDWKDSLFGDVFDVLPPNLQQQQRDLDDLIRRYPSLLEKLH